MTEYKVSTHLDPDDYEDDCDDDVFCDEDEDEKDDDGCEDDCMGDKDEDKYDEDDDLDADD